MAGAELQLMKQISRLLLNLPLSDLSQHLDSPSPKPHNTIIHPQTQRTTRIRNLPISTLVNTCPPQLKQIQSTQNALEAHGVENSPHTLEHQQPKRTPAQTLLQMLRWLRVLDQDSTSLQPDLGLLVLAEIAWRRLNTQMRYTTMNSPFRQKKRLSRHLVHLGNSRL
jgi:hypothetical protein